MNKKYLDVPFEIKVDDADPTGLFQGYGSVFGGKADAYRDVIVPGAFAKSLAEGGRNGTGVALLYQHNSHEPIGVWKELAENKKGLRVVGQLAMETTKGKDVYELLALGALKGLSIGYDTVTHEWDDKKKIRYLKEVDLWEISLVTFPANTRATVTGVKELLQQATTERELEAALRDSDVFSKADAQHIISLCKAVLRDSEPRTNGEGLSLILDSLKEVNLDIRPEVGMPDILNSLQKMNI